MPRKATGQVVEKQRTGGRRVYALRFRAYGERQYVTLGRSTDDPPWTRARAEEELENVLADVRRGIWRPDHAEAEQPAGPRREPTFHEFASEWLAARRHELGKRTIEDYEWALSCHLLAYFARHRLSEITAEEIDRYKAAKVREREQRLVERPLSNNSINKTLTRLSQILEVAVEYGHLDRNPARGRRRRLKGEPRRRASMGAEQVKALLQAAGCQANRALLATAIMGGGLRISELTALRWRDVDLARALLWVAQSKTEAGVRQVELDPALRDELAEYRAATDPRPADYLFPGRAGGRRDRHAVRNRVLYPAIGRANEALAEQGLPAISPEVTFHSLRRTYASLCAEAGVDAAWTAAQIGHTDSRFTINVYTDVQHRRPGAAARVGSLIRGDQGDSLGTSAQSDDLEPEPQPAARRL
jgi:integrase